jgi:hypothetical protein
MEPNDTPDGVEEKVDLTTSRSAYIEWLLEQGQWWTL